MGGFLKVAKSERSLVHAESTHESVRFSVARNKDALTKLFREFDRAEQGLVSEENLIKVLHSYGIFLKKSKLSAFRNQDTNFYDYNSLLQHFA